MQNDIKSPKNIYYLDDDSDDLDFFKEVAEAMGHRVSIFSNSNDLLQVLLDNKLPDIIFLDIQMPLVCGDEILQTIRKTDAWKQIPLIMITDSYPKSQVHHYLGCGANYMMKKPGSPEDLRHTLAYVVSIDWTNFHAYN